MKTKDAAIKRLLKITAVMLGAALAVCVFSAGMVWLFIPTEVVVEVIATSIPTKAPQPTNTPTPTSIPARVLVPGTYIVGRDIQPGTYQGQAGEDIFKSCYWARLSDLSGELDSILANDNAIGQFYVEVRETDFAFETKCELRLVGED